MNTIIWLLGYDASKSDWLDKTAMDQPIRPQRESSHWATAWCVVLFLRARMFLASKHSDVVSEIDRRLMSDDYRINPLPWLLKEARDAENGRMIWYGKEYDNAVAALALLEVKRAAQMKANTFRVSANTLEKA